MPPVKQSSKQSKGKDVVAELGEESHTTHWHGVALKLGKGWQWKTSSCSYAFVAHHMLRGFRSFPPPPLMIDPPGRLPDPPLLPRTIPPHCTTAHHRAPSRPQPGPKPPALSENRAAVAGQGQRQRAVAWQGEGVVVEGPNGGRGRGQGGRGHDGGSGVVGWDGCGQEG